MSNTNRKTSVPPQRLPPTGSPGHPPRRIPCSNGPPTPNSSANPRAAGFSLIEAMFASMILGSGVVALMMLIGSATNVNAAGNRLSQAVTLADQARSLTDSTSFDQLSTYDGQTLYALDASENPIAALQDYQQNISVTAVNSDSLTTYTGTDPTTYLLTVDILYAGEKLTTLTWLRTE